TCRSLMGVQILATGSYVPDIVVTNDDLHRSIGLPAAALYRHTGIRERWHAPPGQATSDLCVEAGRRCLERAGARPRDVDLLLIATVTPGLTFPPPPRPVQGRMGPACPAPDPPRPSPPLP